MKITIQARQPNSADYLWKYMSLQKFLSFLLNGDLYYSRLDTLEDTYEGISQFYLSTLLMHQLNEKDELIDTNHPMYEKLFFKMPLSKLEEQFLERQRRHYVSCWITNQRESAGMWNLYSEPGGIAVRIRYEDMLSLLGKEEFKFSQQGNIEELTYGQVDYSDFTDRMVVSSASFKVKRTAFRKDLSFEHEKEFRVSLKVTKPIVNEIGITS